MIPLLAVLFFMQDAAAAPPLGPPPKAAAVDGAIGEVVLGPIFDRPFLCGQHAFGELDYAGDALGSDCMVTGGIDGAAGYMKLYRTDGRSNADWYGWRAPVLAPVSGRVLGILTKPGVNRPGTMGPPPAAQIRILTDDGVIVVLAHLTDFRIKAGDRVTAGQVIALDGSNGMARNPHVHVGAYRAADNVPLQIRWDLRAMAARVGKAEK